MHSQDQLSQNLPNTANAVAAFQNLPDWIFQQVTQHLQVVALGHLGPAASSSQVATLPAFKAFDPLPLSTQVGPTSGGIGETNYPSLQSGEKCGALTSAGKLCRCPAKVIGKPGPSHTPIDPCPVVVPKVVSEASTSSTAQVPSPIAGPKVSPEVAAPSTDLRFFDKLKQQTAKLLTSQANSTAKPVRSAARTQESASSTTLALTDQPAPVEVANSGPFPDSEPEDESDGPATCHSVSSGGKSRDSVPHQEPPDPPEK